MSKINTFFIVGIVYLILFITNVISNMPENIISIKNKNNILFNFSEVLAQQGWSFFTKSPRDNQLYIYKVEANNLKHIPINNFLLKNNFGLSKTNRIVHGEFMDIINITDKKYFFELRNNNNKIDLKKLNTLKYKNKYNYLDDGIYILSIESIYPWTLFSMKPNMERTRKISVIKIKVINT